MGTRNICVTLRLLYGRIITVDFRKGLMFSLGQETKEGGMKEICRDVRKGGKRKPELYRIENMAMYNFKSLEMLHSLGLELFISCWKHS